MDKNGPHAHNVSGSLLTTAGKSEFICYSRKDYVDQAVRYANAGFRWNKAQFQLEILKSDLCNARKFMSQVENLFWDLWCRWAAEAKRQHEDASKNVGAPAPEQQLLRLV